MVQTDSNAYLTTKNEETNEDQDPMLHSNVAYICDRTSCGKECPSRFRTKGDCHHTTDIKHAKNFTRMAEHAYFEEPQIANVLETKYFEAGFIEYFLDCGHSVIGDATKDEPHYCSTCGKLIEEPELYSE